MNRLEFNGIEFSQVDRNGIPWLLASEVAQALEYSRVDKVNQLYERNKDEFTDSMTMLLENLTLGHGNLTTQTRVFSLRGAHLIGMLARTKKAKEFRRWVLDILEGHKAQSFDTLSQYQQVLYEYTSRRQYASMCGKELNMWKQDKTHLESNLLRLENELQPILI